VNRSRVLAFKLGGTAQLPAPKLTPPAEPKPPARFGTEAQLAQGKALYMRFCSTCHGDTAVGGGVVPDLRSSLAIQSADKFNPIVLGGALKDDGMVSFAEVLKPEEAEAIRAYIVGRANDAH